MVRKKGLERFLQRAYARFVRPHVRELINRQRLKLLVFGWGYWPVLFISALPLLDRLRMIVMFFRVDWNVLHGHRPCEIARIVVALAGRPVRAGEIMVEAGCWQGGSSTKFSIACKTFGYGLRIYDSFEGVMQLTPEEKAQGYDYSGEYSASESLVREHLQKYGAPEVCSLHKGWFSETLAASPVAEPIRLVYIDCDVARGTRDVLAGTLPGLVSDGLVFSQDYHIKPVRALLHDPATWRPLGRGTPEFEPMCGNLVLLRFTS